MSTVISQTSSSSSSSTSAVVASIDELPVGSLRMVRVGDRRVCLVRTSAGVFALDHACPHEGYGLTQGSLDGELLTCAWHNWKFRVGDGACVLGEEGVRTHRVDVGADGSVRVAIDEPDPADERDRLFASLDRAIEKDRLGQTARDAVRLLRASADPGEVVWRAIAHGAPRNEFGWGHSVASAADCLAMVEHYDGDERALPIVQAIANLSEEARDRPVRPLPDPVRSLPGDPSAAFRRAVEEERLEEAEALVLGAIEAGLDADALRSWFTTAVSDHHLSYGHGAIYAQKAFELLDRLGWDRAPTVLPHLVPSIVYGTREDTLPYMRPFVRALGDVDLGALADVGTVVDWDDEGGVLRDAVLGADRTAPLSAAVRALRDGAGVDRLLDVVVAAVSERLLRYDLAGELDFDDDFGWLDITHGLTYADAARWHHAGAPGPDTVRLALWCVFQAHWTGRHEWHTTVGPNALYDGVASSGPATTEELVAACREHRPDAAVAAAAGLPLTDAASTLQHAALLDGTTAPIVHAHAVKTSRAAAREAARSGSVLPLAATARFVAAPKLERFVAATVTRSIEFVAGRRPEE